MTTASFLQTSKFEVNRVYTTLTSSKKTVLKSLFLSFSQFISDVLVVSKEKGTFKNLFPYKTHKSNSGSVDCKVITDINALGKAKCIISPGHNFPIDPGATFPVKGLHYSETEVVTHFLDSLILAMEGSFAKLTVDILPWNELRYTIGLINDITKRRSKTKNPVQYHISIHSDFAVRDVEARPLTLGLYYCSPAGQELALKLSAFYLERMKKDNPSKKAASWVRRDTESPHGRLGVIRDTIPVSLIAELDFVSRPFEDQLLVHQAFADVLVHDSALLDS